MSEKEREEQRDDLVKAHSLLRGVERDTDDADLEDELARVNMAVETLLAFHFNVEIGAGARDA